ncbi:DDE-domain-containing protein, partial [Didymella exigua CBS 183.55]
ARTTAANYETIRVFLELFERTQIKLGIQYEDIWNMDKTSVSLRVCTNTRVIANSSKKKAYIKSPEDREWVSILETISATGTKLQCLVVFKGKHLQTTWFPAQGVPNWLYTTSENGWTSNSIGSEWLQRIFIPNTTPSQGRWRLLLLDGHGSHTPIDFMWTCRRHQIYLLYLPPHASHVLQPLDLAPFSVVKTHYRTPIKKERFVTSYNKAREEGLSERVIRAGWKAAGLCPYNLDLVILSSQISGRPVTPPPSTQPIDDVFATPQSSQALHRAYQQLLLSESLSRSTRVVLSKAGKAIARANTRAARLESENQRLKYQLD